MNQDQWARETTPPIRHRPPNPDPFGLLWLAEHLAKLILERPCDPRLKGRAERIPCRMDPSCSPLVTAWIIAEVENYCAKRGRPVVLASMDRLPLPPSPGELLASSMSRLPALPPTAGGLVAPAKA